MKELLLDFALLLRCLTCNHVVNELVAGVLAAY